MVPEVAARIAQHAATSNPVVQMADPAVFKAFSVDELEIIQWDQLEEDMQRCADYQLMPSHAEVRRLWQSAIRDARAGGKVQD